MGSSPLQHEKLSGSIQDYRTTVLLVDDQPIIAESVRQALEKENDIDFHYCQDPTRALKVANEIRPTLILQDLVMPELDGLMMVKFFRANAETANVPVVVLSAKEEPQIKSQAFALGANDYLVKLPDRIELIARIRYHSQAYITSRQRDEAYNALVESQLRLHEANRELQRLSVLDGLTSIANRRHFDEFLRQEWHRAKRNTSALSLIMLDIDFFKAYNDYYGHQGGDDCLKTVASTLEKSVQRETDLVARYGGEEFAVVLPDTAENGACEVADIIRSKVESLQIPHAKSQVSKVVTVSVGVATMVPERDSSPSALIKAADIALYGAKNAGRNRIKIHEQPLNEHPKLDS